MGQQRYGKGADPRLALGLLVVGGAVAWWGTRGRRRADVGPVGAPTAEPSELADRTEPPRVAARGPATAPPPPAPAAAPAPAPELVAAVAAETEVAPSAEPAVGRHGPRHLLALDLIDGFLIFFFSTCLWLGAYAYGPTLIGWESRAIISGSMQPTIRPGDVVVVKPGAVDLKPGVLVTFDDPSQPGRVLTHRVVRLNDDGEWVTKGDANPQEDSAPVPPEAILGQPRTIVPLIGLPAYWRHQGTVPPPAWVLGFLLVGVLGARRFLALSEAEAVPEQVASAEIPAQRARPADSESAEGAQPKEQPWASASASP